MLYLKYIFIKFIKIFLEKQSLLENNQAKFDSLDLSHESKFKSNSLSPQSINSFIYEDEALSEKSSFVTLSSIYSYSSSSNPFSTSSSLSETELIRRKLQPSYIDFG